MAADLRYKIEAAVDIKKGGYHANRPGMTDPDRYEEWRGANPAWQGETTSNPTGSMEYEYYYSDSDTGDNYNSSRVSIVARDEWEVSVNPDNSLHVEIETTIKEFKRWQIRGNPNYGGGKGREILVKVGDNVVANIPHDDIGTEHSLNFNPGPFHSAYDIPAGGTERRSPIYVWNHSIGYAVAEPYLDEMYTGATITNLLPKEFPHKVTYYFQNGRGETEVHEWKDVNQCTGHSITSTVPKNPHWIFKGWSTNPNASEGNYYAGNSVTVCENLDLYAIWEYTYRPGMVRHNGVWKSCDRDGATGPVGRAQILRNGKWIEMRIRITTTQGLEDPPCIYKGDWVKMRLIGDEGRPHNINWDCPHEWPKNY